MTQNQLKYWELRWKQFYDMRKLELEKYVEDRKLLLDMKKLDETIRHNRHQEKMDRLEYQQNQQKINQEWAKISQNERLAMIKYGIDYVKLQQENIKLNQSQQQIGLKAQELLQKEFLGMADLMLEISKTADHESREWVETYSKSVGEFLKAFGGGLIGTGMGEIRGALSTTVYNELTDQLIKSYPQFADKLEPFRRTANETFGPQTGHEVGKLADDQLREATAKLYADQQKAKYSNQLPGTDDKRVIGFSGTQESDGVTQSRDKYGHKEFKSSRDAGSTKEAVSVRSNSGGSGVIYSPGTHYGPGF